MKGGKQIEPDSKEMTFEQLKQYSNGILWDDCQDYLYKWVDKIQQYRNAIHAFLFRDIGTTSDFLFDIDEYLEFVKSVASRLPPIEDYKSELLPDCY